MDMGLSKLQETVKDRESWHAAVQGGHKEPEMTEWLNNNNKKGGKLPDLQNPRKAQELQVLRYIWRKKQKTEQMEQKTKKWVQKPLPAV